MYSKDKNSQRCNRQAEIEIIEDIARRPQRITSSKLSLQMIEKGSREAYQGYIRQSERKAAEHIDLQSFDDEQIKESEFNIDSILIEEPMEDQQPNARPQFVSESQLLSRINEVQEHVNSSNRKFESSKRQKNTKFPSLEQIKGCLNQLQSSIPNEDLQSVLTMLHNACHKDCREQAKLPIENDGYGFDIQRQARNEEEVKIAYSFISHGYGLKVLREKIRDPSINANKYNNIITTIMKTTFRSVESVMKQLGEKIRSINGIQQKMLRAPLINCQKWLSPDELATYYEFVKAVYGLGRFKIQPPQVHKLYVKIMKQLRQRQLQEALSKDESKGKGKTKAR